MVCLGIRAEEGDPGMSLGSLMKFGGAQVVDMK